MLVFMHTTSHMEVRGKSVEISSHLPSYRSQESNAGHQTWLHLTSSQFSLNLKVF